MNPPPLTAVTFSVQIATFSAALLFIFLLLRLRRRDHAVTVTPPSPPHNLPFIGHLHHILLSPAPPHQALALLAARHGPLLHLRLGQVPTLLLSSPSLARSALKPLDPHLSSRPRLLSSHHLSFASSDITFSPSGPYWRQARRLCLSHLLSPKQAQSFHLLRLRELDRLLSSLGSSSGCETDMSQRFFSLANDVLCRVAFGRRFVGDRDDRQSGEAATMTMARLAGVLEETQRLFGGFCLGDFYPGLEWVGWVTGLRWRLGRNLRELRRVCDEIIGEHLEKGRGGGDGVDGGEEREDFLDVLLRVQRSGDLEVPITDDNVKALVLDMFVAGTDTTATTLEWAMTELVRHPTILAKAQAEVRSMVTTTNTTTPQVSHLHDLKYMKAIIKETLRLHPPAPLLVPRESISECTIEGFKIPPKTRVLINAYAIGRDPETWAEPLEFKPERFEGNESIDVKGNEFELIPFGGGRRGCPGYSFGLATIEIALARLLCHFDWSLGDGVRPEDVDLSEIFGLATRKKVPLVLVPSVNKEFEWKGEA